MAKTRAIVLLGLATLVLSIAAGTAWAAPTTPAAIPFAMGEEVEVEVEEDEEATAAEECEEAQAEFAAGEINAEAVAEYCASEARRPGKSSSGGVPEECILRSAHGHASADEQAGTLKLTIGYTTFEPTNATIDVGSGASRIASLHRQLGRSGVLRIVESLHGDNAPKQLTVRFRIASAEKAGCPSRRLVLFPK
jgi:hypothetical protein